MYQSTEDKAFKIKDTRATQKIFSLKKRIRAVCGGTSASKTISILVWCIDYGQSTKDELISVVSESYPHLEKGAIYDFKRIMRDRGYWDDDCWNETKHFYTFIDGSKIEFFSPDTYGKAHGPRRDVLFLNECINLSYEIVDQLMVRTRKIVWMDWNQSAEFWYYTEIEGRRDDIDFLILTYKDNDALDETTIKEIESHKDNKSWWKVYGLGLRGEIEGKVYKDWQTIDSVPHEARLISYGLDFGYKNDPTAICAIYYLNGGFIIDEITYTLGLFNKNIADILLAHATAPVIADSAEPKSIDELRLYGLTIISATKGKGSVSQGIAFVQQQRMSVTQRSVNFIKSYRNYIYKVDSDGKVTNDPDHHWSDGMDAVRYGLQIKQNLTPQPEYKQLPYESHGLQDTYRIEDTVEVPMPFNPHRR